MTKLYYINNNSIVVASSTKEAKQAYTNATNKNVDSIQDLQFKQVNLGTFVAESESISETNSSSNGLNLLN